MFFSLSPKYLAVYSALTLQQKSNRSADAYCSERSTKMPQTNSKASGNEFAAAPDGVVAVTAADWKLQLSVSQQSCMHSLKN